MTWRSPAISRASDDAARLLAQLTDAVASMSEPFVLWDEHDRLVICNEKYRDRFGSRELVKPGVSFAELVEDNIRHGTNIQMAEVSEAYLHPDAYRRRRIELHQSGRDTFQILMRDGRWLQTRERRTGAGGIVGIYTDITEQKRVEAALVAAQQAAEEANQSKSRFLAAASHDLRQPLHAIALLVSALESKVAADDQRELVDGVRDCLETMTALFDSLLDISKLDAGVVEPSIEPVDIGALVAAVSRDYKGLAARKGLRLRAVPAALWCPTDPALLGRIVRNFVSNAVKYTDSGGVLIGVRRRAGRAVIEVHDTGEGFPLERKDELFAEFRRLEVGPVRQQGLGLGLAIATRMASLMGHTLDVRSEPGRGSVFSIDLGPPYAGVPARWRSSRIGTFGLPSTMPGDLSGLRVLVADDDRDVLQATRALLESWGCLVETTAEAADPGLAKAPDACLIDYHLAAPRAGLAMAQGLRARFGQDLPAWIVTGNTAAEELQRIEQSGLRALHKPLKPLRLRALLAGIATQPQSS